MLTFYSKFREYFSLYITRRIRFFPQYPELPLNFNKLVVIIIACFACDIYQMLYMCSQSLLEPYEVCIITSILQIRKMY